MAVDPSGNIYVADVDNDRIQMFDSTAYAFEVADPQDQTILSKHGNQKHTGFAGNANEASNVINIDIDRHFQLLPE